MLEHVTAQDHRPDPVRHDAELDADDLLLAAAQHDVVEVLLTENQNMIKRFLQVVNELVDTMFSVRDYIVMAGIGVGAATIATIVLVFMLSTRLRRREIETIRKIGGARKRLIGILAAEIILVAAAGVGIAALLTSVVSRFGDVLIRIVTG